MRVFAAEREAGLADALQGYGRLQLAAAALPGTPFTASPQLRARAAQFLGKDVAAVEDPDLFPLNSVLVSTGWNRNHAVFLPEEVAAARHTPEDKPFNYEHDEADVIGHITAVTARDKDGVEIPPGSPVEDYPAQFDLHTSAVLYAHWSDPKLKERMDGILLEIAQGKWFVSMECLYRDFDYALREQDGTQKVIARNKATAFLTKRLKAFGGDGTYNGAELGQVLKAFLFSGKGLVKTPANPDSIIYPYSAQARFYTSCEAAGYQPVTGPTVEPLMDELKKQVAELEAKVAAAATETAAEKAKVAAAEKAKADADAALEAEKAKAADVAARLAAETEKVTASAKEVESLKAKVAETETARASLEAELAKVGTELKTVTRTQAAVAAGLEADEAAKLVGSQLDLSDDKFNTGLEVVKAQGAKAVKAAKALPERETAGADTAVLPEGKAAAGTVTPPATGAGAKASKGLAKGILAHASFKTQASRQENK
jgi:hypothetical protein